MSNWPGRRPRRGPSSSSRSIGTPPVRGRPSPSTSGAGDAPDEVGVEALVARRDRGVDGEDAVAGDLVQASSSVARRRPAPAPARRAGTPSGPR